MKNMIGEIRWLEKVIKSYYMQITRLYIMKNILEILTIQNNNSNNI